MIILKVVLVLYVLGVLLTALLAVPVRWNKTAGLSSDQIKARRIACVFASLFWFAFFPKAIVTAVAKASVKG